MLRIQEFAKRTGVTVRTLHHYDRLGLLRPSGRTRSGYRLYGEGELARLQQITALKFIGCSLPQIKAMLDGSPHAEDLETALKLQQEALERRRHALDLALQAVARAQQVLCGEGRADWEALRKIIEVIEMEANHEWTKKYFSKEQLAELEKRRNEDPGVAERGQRAWAELLPKVEAAAQSGVEPSSEQARDLAQRWSDLVSQFTGGDRGMTQILNKLYQDSQKRDGENLPVYFQRPWSDMADRWIKAAMRANGISCE